jgi:hypothetical protein
MDTIPLVERVKERRKQQIYTIDEYHLIKSIRQLTQHRNRDNVTRTKSYLEFYKKFPEMEWAFLASMVSRNAGWNMTDLKCEPIFRLLSDDYLMVLFHTYERPNWLIFHDAYPQLLLYASSVERKRPLFHLLKAFEVSLFMEAEWEHYWRSRDGKRLSYALITNEQHVIQQPVIQHGYYSDKVFGKMIFKLEEALRLNAVVFPDLQGALYGFSVTNFKKVESRINLGKRLYALLFHIPESQQIREFGLTIEHTGARFDYERFHQHGTSNQQHLRELYHAIHHRRLVVQDWFNGQVSRDWFENPQVADYQITHWYRKKRKRLSRLGSLIKPSAKM